MLKIFGSAIVLLVGIYLGNKLCSEQRIKLITIEALIEFTEFIKTSIYTSRMPLMEIYALFDNKSLHERGFIYQLNQHGLKSALCTVSEYISDKSLTTLNSFADNIGGGVIFQGYIPNAFAFCSVINHKARHIVKRFFFIFVYSH